MLRNENISHSMGKNLYANHISDKKTLHIVQRDSYNLIIHIHFNNWKNFNKYLTIYVNGP